MKILERIADKFGFQRKVPKQRGFSLGAVDRLVADWNEPLTSADSKMRNDLQLMIQRAQMLETDDDYFRNYLGLLNNNVLGHCGIRLQSKIANADGVFNRPINRQIEDWYAQWSKREFFSWDGTMSRQEMESLILRRVAVDGGVLIRKVYDRSNPYGLSFQLIEIQQLAMMLNQRNNDKSEVRMGVQFRNGRREAYHIYDRHPGDFGFASQKVINIIPASQIIHIFRPERIGQTHGLPWCVSTGRRAKQLNAYEEAEVIAARMGACKAGAITQAQPDGYGGEKDSMNNTMEDMQPGTWLKLNPGETAAMLDPTHPTTAYPDFIRTQRQGYAVGLETSYASLTGDLSQANFSSMREGKQMDQESWMAKQEWFFKCVSEPMLIEGMELSMLSGALNISDVSFQRFQMQHIWKGRRWGYVDPQKDVEAIIAKLGAGLTSLSGEIAERGGDAEEVLQQIAEDKQLAASYGITLNWDASINQQVTQDTTTTVD